jgi:SnoaL-like domain
MGFSTPQAPAFGARVREHAVMERGAVEAWVERYERVWRTPGTDGLGELFTDDASYRVSPFATPIVGADALAEFWDAGRVSAAEVFAMTSAVVAVDGDTAVVRVTVDYEASGTHWRDLWVLEFAADGRCRAFEEWPFLPDQPDGH